MSKIEIVQKQLRPLNVHRGRESNAPKEHPNAQNCPLLGFILHVINILETTIHRLRCPTVALLPCRGPPFNRVSLIEQLRFFEVKIEISDRFFTCSEIFHFLRRSGILPPVISSSEIACQNRSAVRDHSDQFRFEGPVTSKVQFPMDTMKRANNSSDHKYCMESYYVSSEPPSQRSGAALPL